MAFSSWAQTLSDLKNKLADSTATNEILQSGYTTKDGATVNFRSLTDLIKYLEYVQTMANSESNVGSRRTPMFTAGYGNA